MKTGRFIAALMCGLVSLTLALSSCGSAGSNGGNAPSYSKAASKAARIGFSKRIPVLRSINLTPIDPLGISPGTQIQFTATGYYTDNSVQDLTTLVVWTSSDTSIASVSNVPGSIGLATAVSGGYCSISATFGNISKSTILGIL